MYSNVIFFGDSQSDIGNVPSSNILIAANKLKNKKEVTVDGAINQVLSNLSYIPISNPVKLSGSNKFKVPCSDEKFNHPNISYLNSNKHPCPC
jgi:hypothetical protein